VTQTHQTAAAETAASPKLEINCSRQFPEWLVEQRVSLAFTTYQNGKLFLIGLRRPAAVGA
jgi:hypothetical protein